jgi:uncharacterized protein YuzE
MDSLPVGGVSEVPGHDGVCGAITKADRCQRSEEQGREALEPGMKITYDPETDIVRVEFSGAPIEESDEEKPGLILDYDRDGNIVGLEILDASKRMENPRSLEYAVAG